jgi:carboxymethylenebutenolidase
MSKIELLVMFLFLASFLSVSVCAGYSGSDVAPEKPDTSGVLRGGPEADIGIENESGSIVFASDTQTMNFETAKNSCQIRGLTVNITSEGKTYPAYTAAPAAEGNYPAVVLIHSFNGFEPGYKDMMDRMAADGFVVVAPQWQTYSRSPSDSEVEALIRNSVSYLENRNDVDPEKLGLTGFCAGGRYTMLFLPQIKEFKIGVAWYGFPYTGGTEVQPVKPASLIDQLEVPMLIIHGTRDQFSNISDIYRYAGELDAEDKYFELKVYQGEPHGFMVQDGELSESSVAQDAYDEMINFFDRTLNNRTQDNLSK